MNDCRIITTLLLSKNGFIKTKRFNYYRYIGDPINTLRILNDQEAQEIIILDVDKKNNNQDIDIEYLKKITSECFSPLSYGGGIKTLDNVLIYSTVFFWIATSSLASRNAVANKSLSLSSYFPPGKLICPEWKPGYLLRSIKTKLS